MTVGDLERIVGHVAPPSLKLGRGVRDLEGVGEPPIGAGAPRQERETAARVRQRLTCAGWWN
jgi:hypothetical protein